MKGFKLGLILGIIYVTIGSFGLENVFAGDVDPATYRITKQWEMEKVLKVPESILYDEATNIIYVSNINGKPAEKNGLGFISKLSVDGKIQVLEWCTGLNAPKGAAIHGDKFYVSDIDHLVEIDLNTGKILTRYPAQSAHFLNDVAADALGNVYVSDSSQENSLIYKLTKGIMTVWLKGEEIDRPNGLHMGKDRLLVGNSGDGTIKAVDLADKKIHFIARVGSGIDGLRPDGKGNYFVSDWKGKTALVSPTGQVIEILNTTETGINAADLEYIINEKLLLIPTFFDNRVMAYKVK